MKKSGTFLMLIEPIFFTHPRFQIPNEPLYLISQFQNLQFLNYHDLKEEKADQSKDSDDAGQLSDEGLGDITSEASNSPQPPPKDPDSLTNNNEHFPTHELENYLHPPSSQTGPKSSLDKSEKERIHCDNPRKAFMENLIEGGL